MRKIYLAAQYARNPEMRQVRNILHGLGYSVTSRWIDQHDGSLEEALGEAELGANPERGVPFALKDIEDIRAADTVIHFTGAGRGGRHTEFGIAIALGKSLILIGPREHVFHTLPQILWFPDMPALIRYLLEDPMPEPREFVSSSEWTDDEWLRVINTFPPEATPTAAEAAVAVWRMEAG
jgi:hypothetical protein